MVVIDTYIKAGSDFIKIEDFQGKVSDPIYVEGAIYLRINEKELLTPDLWDDVNWLWGFIVNGLEDLRERSSWTTGFPDQPIDLTFDLDRRTGRIRITVDIPEDKATGAERETRTTSTSFNEFLTALHEAGKTYFTHITEIGGGDGSGELRRLDKAIDNLYLTNF